MKRFSYTLAFCSACWSSLAAYAVEQKASTLQATTAQPNSAPWWFHRHQQQIDQIKQANRVDLIFVGDSLTQSWEDAGKKTWTQYYGKRHALNLGISGDRTEHVLWRLRNGATDGLSPKVAVVLIGTNNVGHRNEPADETATGIRMVVEEIRTRLPQTKILLLAIFPREENLDHPRRIRTNQINEKIEMFAKDPMVRYLDIGNRYLDDDGKLLKSIVPDFLHPNAQGYQLWAEAIEPTIAELMGDSKTTVESKSDKGR